MDRKQQKAMFARMGRAGPGVGIRQPHRYVARVWTPEMWKERAQSERQFACTWAHGNTREEKENCGGCCLRGYRPHNDPEWPKGEPNYASWERDYVKTGRAIPKKYRKAFDEAVHGHVGNEAFSKALRRDIQKFGVRYL
jgi:hypothetical protein